MEINDLPIEIITYILSYTCLYIDSQVCKCWKEIFCTQPNYKIYITHPRVYNYYRYNRYISTENVIVDCMLENSVMSRKLLNIMFNVDHIIPRKSVFDKFFQQATSCDILVYLPVSYKLRLKHIAEQDISLASIKHIMSYGQYIRRFKFTSNNKDLAKCIEYLEIKGYSHVIKKDNIIMRIQ